MELYLLQTKEECLVPGGSTAGHHRCTLQHKSQQLWNIPCGTVWQGDTVNTECTPTRKGTFQLYVILSCFKKNEDDKVNAFRGSMNFLLKFIKRKEQGYYQR